MRSPSRSNYAAQPSISSGGIVGNGYAHSSSSNNFGSERVKSPSPIITSVHTPHRSSTSNRSKDTPSSRSTSNGKSSRSSSHRDDVGHHSSSSGRSRSPPVVTIAPTLNSGLHYQDSRKVPLQVDLNNIRHGNEMEPCVIRSRRLILRKKDRVAYFM